MKKILSLLLVLSLILISAVSCGKDEDVKESDGIYDPYVNRFKPDPPTDKKISVAGKTFYFEELEIRNKNEEKQVTAENSLSKLYVHVSVEFISEDTVLFDDSGYHEIFNIPETKCERDMNVLTFKHTNSDGYTYDVRIEIHKDMIIVIHDGHTYNNPGTYATITFTE